MKTVSFTTHKTTNFSQNTTAATVDQRLQMNKKARKVLEEKEKRKPQQHPECKIPPSFQPETLLSQLPVTSEKYEHNNNVFNGKYLSDGSSVSGFYS